MNDTVEQIMRFLQTGAGGKDIVKDPKLGQIIAILAGTESNDLKLDAVKDVVVEASSNIGFADIVGMTAVAMPEKIAISWDETYQCFKNVADESVEEIIANFVHGETLGLLRSTVFLTEQDLVQEPTEKKIAERLVDLTLGRSAPAFERHSSGSFSEALLQYIQQEQNYPQRRLALKIISTANVSKMATRHGYVCGDDLTAQFLKEFPWAVFKSLSIADRNLLANSALKI